MLCDQFDTLDENTLFAKKIRNRPLTSYLCSNCNMRVSEKSKVRFMKNTDTQEEVNT